MDTKHAFATALKKVRKARKLTQEDFSDVSSRTYVSSLERGIKSPTLDKIDSLSKALSVHPLTLLFLTYATLETSEDVNKIFDLINVEIKQVAGFR